MSDPTKDDQPTTLGASGTL